MNSLNRKEFVNCLNDSFGFDDNSGFELGNKSIMFNGYSCKSRNIDIINLWAEKVISL